MCDKSFYCIKHNPNIPDMTLSEAADASLASIEKEDLHKLLPLVAEIKPKNILEIGMWKGYSMKVWFDAFQPTMLLGIEKQTRDEVGGYEIHSLRANYIWGKDSHDPQIFDDVKTVMPEVDFLFIDGDHSYEGVRKDFEMYSRLVRSGGIIAFHDALYHHDKTEEVDEFWSELKKKYKSVELKESPNSTGIGVIFYE